MPSRSKPVIGITLGDPAGIGPEVTAKALAGLRSKAFSVRIVGDAAALRPFGHNAGVYTELLDLNVLKPSHLKAGRPNRHTAQASLQYLEAAVELLRSGEIDTLVTAPVCKESISELGVPFHGHTEFLAAHFKIRDYEMMFVAPEIKTIIATRHIPVAAIPRAISKKNIFWTISMADRSLRELFGIQRPHLAICGLNPHAGEGGTIGKEEIQTIIPAIRQAQKAGIRITGPLAADTLFVPGHAKPYDLIIAIYHDQGLAPVKALYFDRLVNLTVGLPFIRTSPAHGTAFDIAGKNEANPSSMREAICLAAKLSTHRQR